MIMRSVVKALHASINDALSDVAKRHGFTFKPGSLRFDSLSVSGRMEFILQGKEKVLAQRRAPWNSKINVGDKVKGTWDDLVYEVVDFTRRGSAIILSPKGFRYRARVDALSVVK